MDSLGVAVGLEDGGHRQAFHELLAGLREVGHLLGASAGVARPVALHNHVLFRSQNLLVRAVVGHKVVAAVL